MDICHTRGSGADRPLTFPMLCRGRIWFSHSCITIGSIKPKIISRYEKRKMDSHQITPYSLEYIQDANSRIDTHYIVATCNALILSRSFTEMIRGSASQPECSPNASSSTAAAMFATASFCARTR